MNKITVGYDGAERSSRTLTWAAAEAARWGAELDVVHVWHRERQSRRVAAIGVAETEDAAKQTLEVGLASLQNGSGPHHTTGRLIHSLSVSDGLIAAGADADLVVIGARGSESRHSAGSTVDSVIKHSRVPVVVVP